MCLGHESHFRVRGRYDGEHIDLFVYGTLNITPLDIHEERKRGQFVITYACVHSTPTGLQTNFNDQENISFLRYKLVTADHSYCQRQSNGMLNYVKYS